MRLTRQVFVLVADVLADLRAEYGDTIPHWAIVNRFTRALRATNPNFDTDRFETRAKGN